MSAGNPIVPPGESRITVRYWAAARAASGIEADVLQPSGPVTLDVVLDEVRALHSDPRFARVVAACSVLVGDRPVGRRTHRDVVVAPGETVELLPPFAGG